MSGAALLIGEIQGVSQVVTARAAIHGASKVVDDHGVEVNMIKGLCAKIDAVKGIDSTGWVQIMQAISASNLKAEYVLMLMASVDGRLSGPGIQSVAQCATEWQHTGQVMDCPWRFARAAEWAVLDLL